MIRAQVAAGWSNESEPYLHEGEECVLVTRGELRITLAGDLYALHEGDSLTYDPVAAALVPQRHRPRRGDHRRDDATVLLRPGEAPQALAPDLIGHPLTDSAADEFHTALDLLA